MTADIRAGSSTFLNLNYAPANPLFFADLTDVRLGFQTHLCVLALSQ